MCAPNHERLEDWVSVTFAPLSDTAITTCRLSSDDSGRTQMDTDWISAWDFSAADGPREVGPKTASGVRPVTPVGRSHEALPKRTVRFAWALTTEHACGGRSAERREPQPRPLLLQIIGSPAAQAHALVGGHRRRSGTEHAFW